MPSSPVYVGIDVACAVGKRLPICFVSGADPVMPLTIPRQLSAAIPRGAGNKEIISPSPFREAAGGVVNAISRVMDEMDWRVERIAIDAPSAPPLAVPRASEKELGHLGLSSFRTPAVSDWAGIREKCVWHLGSGRSAATLPHANNIWMLFGFELFAQLRNSFRAEVIEVYPFAIVRALLLACQHKSTDEGYKDQLAAVAVRMGWAPQDLEARLKGTVHGSRHDRLDAFMAAWVASLRPEQRCAFGDPQQTDDAIWVPL
ncbi:MAG TPA: DUF429 domain-containing protein [Roseiarcus sp.]|nr:DUF429 domain-containing protein [Roseiarcus sp.]